MTTIIKLTVLFNDPFWIGVFEIKDGNVFKACKITFGAEPKDYEVYESILKNFYLFKFSDPILMNMEKILNKKVNPKRLLREVKKEASKKGIETKAQETLKLQYEKSKKEHKKETKEVKESDKIRKFQLKQKKKLEKHKGH